MRKYYFIGTTFLLLIFTSSLVFSQSYIPKWKDAKIKINPVGELNTYAFNLISVKILKGPFTIAMNANVNYLLAIKHDLFETGYTDQIR